MQGMDYKVGMESFFAGIFLAMLSGMVHADDLTGNRDLPSAAGFYSYDFQSLSARSFDAMSFDPAQNLLAANQTGVIPGATDISPAEPDAQFQPPWLSGRKAHQYLGLGTVLFAGLTALSSPGEGCEHNCPAQPAPRQTSGTTHTRFARATAALAVATVVTGLIYHWDDFHLEDGFADPDNQHVMLAGAGALMMLYAINKSAKSTVPTSHAGTAELGAAAMLVAIKLTW